MKKLLTAILAGLILSLWMLPAEAKVKRSSSARRQFMIETGYPRGRPGFEIHHVIPLHLGGPDTPANMIWLPKSDHRKMHIKDQ